jgi:nicotinamide-nucleotide amidase
MMMQPRKDLSMQDLSPLAETIAARLIETKATIAVAEGSAGGLISAALLAVPGASKYFLGSAAIYTASARSALLGIDTGDMSGLRPASEAYALLLARRVRERLGATFGLAESGAAGPTGNRYGDAAGHTCIAIVGSLDRDVARAITVETGSAEREPNMWAFAKRALALTAEAIKAA